MQRISRLRSRKRIRRAIIVLVLIGAVAACLPTIYAMAHQEKQTARTILVVCGMITYLLHVQYLYAVAKHASLSKRIEEVDGLVLWMPLILTLAYVLSAADVITGARTKPFTYGVYSLVYILWVYQNAMHLIKMRSTNDGAARAINQNEAKLETVIWLCADLLCLIVVAVPLAKYLISKDASWMKPIPEMWQNESGTKNNLYFGLKDIAILISSFLVAVYATVRSTLAGDSFQRNYLDFLDARKPESAPSQSHNLLKHGLIGVSSKEIVVCDFGSADGRRSIEMLQCGGLDINKVMFCRYDCGNRFAEIQTPGVNNERVEICSRDRWIERIQACDIVTCAHSLYTLKLATSAIEIFRYARPGTLFMFRGISPDSVFYGLHIQRAYAAWNPAFFHLWDTELLSAACEELFLSPVIPTTRTPPIGTHIPIAILDQTFEDSAKLRDGVVQTFRDQCGPQYADIVAHSLMRTGRISAEVQPGLVLTSRDVVYLFRKGEKTN